MNYEKGAVCSQPTALGNSPHYESRQLVKKIAVRTQRPSKLQIRHINTVPFINCKENSGSALWILVLQFSRFHDLHVSDS